MPKRRRRILRQGENKYSSPASQFERTGNGDPRLWEFDRVDETSVEPCEACDAETTQIFCLSAFEDDFDEKRVCSKCAEIMVKDPAQVRRLDEELSNEGTTAENDVRFQELWDGVDWRRTTSPNNHQKTVAGIYVLVFRARTGPGVGRWNYRIGQAWGMRYVATRAEANRLAFDVARKQYSERRIERAMARDNMRQMRQTRPWENGQPMNMNDVRPIGDPIGVTRIHDSVTLDLPRDLVESEGGLPDMIRRAFGLPDQDADEPDPEEQDANLP